MKKEEYIGKILNGEDGRKAWKLFDGDVRWKNFSQSEFSCSCGCEEIFFDPIEFDKAQKFRELLNRAVKFNSTHRCKKHNKKVGGADDSEHLKIAFDFSMVGILEKELEKLQEYMIAVGWYSFGLYRTFIHTDKRVRKNGNGRFWTVNKKFKQYFKRYIKR